MSKVRRYYRNVESKCCDKVMIYTVLMFVRNGCVICVSMSVERHACNICLWHSVKKKLPVVSLGIFSWLPTEPRALGSTQPLKMSTRDLSWRPTTLVVPNVKKIRGLDLPGTTWATSACCGMTFTFYLTIMKWSAFRAFRSVELTWSARFRSLHTIILKYLKILASRIKWSPK